MMTTKYRIEKVFRGAFVGKVVAVEMWDDGNMFDDFSFRIERVELMGDGFLEIHSNDEERMYELIELGQAITLADKGAMEFTTDKGYLLKFTLKEGREQL